MNIEINNKSLSLELLRNILTEEIAISLSKGIKEKITHSSKYVTNKSEGNDSIYGINTGFGNLANVKIDKSDLNKLQRNLVSSHAVGVGELLPNKIVKLIIVLKIYALAQGYSGASLALVERLCEFINLELYPCIPSKGSVGASGDLAPLAHLSQALIGEGYVNYKGVKLSASKALAKSDLKPIELGPKEGLALLNGTQVSTAIALNAYFETENLFLSAIISGALTLEAFKGSITPFDERIHEARGQKGQIDVAKELSKLIDGSEILKSHANCDRIQDPYSIRCQPQVMGACLDSIRSVSYTHLTLPTKA